MALTRLEFRSENQETKNKTFYMVAVDNFIRNFDY